MKAEYISSPSNIFYLTRIENYDARILIIKNKKYYITDARFIEFAKKMLPQYVTIDSSQTSILNEILKLLTKENITHLGIEESHLTYNEVNQIKATLPNLTLYDISKKYLLKRSRKQKDEITQIIQAQQITDSIYNEVITQIKEGISEKNLAQLIDLEIIKANCTPAFKTIVAFSNNTSCPHAIPTDKKLNIGDPILIDFGAKYNNYCSDMTRSFSYKRASDSFKNIYNHVLKAQEHAIEAINLNVKVSQLDVIVKTYFKQFNLEQNFIHSLGHGVGIDIHEHPFINQKYDSPIQEGNIITIEPGLYFPNNFGIRIEDMILVSLDGVQNLTRSPKTMIIK